ncbi:glutathione hydrolase-like YwrD proenzyme isoform X1 [Conger conger]|uniref:glutathione hydrolase-like YwrD proenzyme isoform X1 n=2 Tax=Conger conger TaxID=82655 RepID=UPI002A59C824|nr:glutathione hydrolase-like YwrD proenzyme isoform X1 [Conger conger]
MCHFRKIMQPELPFSSRRSPVVCLNGCVASSQTLASVIGLDILRRGGNAADAAVAVAAALGVTEPCSTGVGGDCFCLFYDARTGQVRGLNGSGRSPRALTLDLLSGLGFSEAQPPSVFHALNVTVPGAAACWCDTVQLFGSKKLTLGEVLEPAAELAERGFPVAEITAHDWARWSKALKDDGKALGGDFLINNQPPKHGQLFANPTLARTYQELARSGKSGFYEGRIAEAIVDVVGQNDGVMTLDDLKNHSSTEVQPVFTDYKGVRLWECPPNGQGIAALIALNILEHFPMKEMGHNTSGYLHVLTEAFKLSLADVIHFCADPEKVKVPVEGLLSKAYAGQRAQLINMQTAGVNEHGAPPGSDTVYFAVVDVEGNACSFVNSTYLGFGTGLVPENCGFSLHNRGANFSLDGSHGNCVGPEKRPYHTIVPALLTDAVSGRLLCCYGVMGAFMQPQGHVQVLLNMLEFGMNPQKALDAPRIYVYYDKTDGQWKLSVEAGVEQGVAEELGRRGHAVVGPVSGHQRARFGRGQVIAVGCWWDPDASEAETDARVLWAGSDPRADGCALGY